MRLLHEMTIFQTVKSKVIETVRLSVSISLRNLYNSLNSIKERLYCSEKDEEIFFNFTSFSTVFEFYPDDGNVIMKCCVQWNPIYEKISISGPPGPEVIKLFSCSTQLSMKF